MKSLGIIAAVVLLMGWTAWVVTLTLLAPWFAIPALLVTAVVTPLGLWAGHRQRPHSQ